MGKMEKRTGQFMMRQTDSRSGVRPQQPEWDSRSEPRPQQPEWDSRSGVRPQQSEWDSRSGELRSQQSERDNGAGKLRLQQPSQNSERLEVLHRIRLLEQEGKFDVDAEEDPPTIPLLPDQIDYLRTKSVSRMKTKAAYTAAKWFVNSLIRQKKLVIRQVIGMENLNHVKSGAVLTCNHFHPHDCLTVEYLFQHSEQVGKKQLFKVIREGNYTNFPGFYGMLFRNCNTLPLSQKKETMYHFLKAVDTILSRGDFILIYPEQSMWWNYRKPKPLKNGAYKFAVKNHVPVIPFFIAMEDGDIIDEDGFPVQEYTIFIKEPIYPQTELAAREQAQAMKEENARIWKQVYEEFYGCPLTYTVSQDGR